MNNGEPTGGGDLISTTIHRRGFLRLVAAIAGAGVLSPWAIMPTALAEDAAGTIKPKFQMAKFPEKAELILLTDRPPNLEMPAKYFAQDITPNEAMFVRWHIGIIPTRVNTATFRLSLKGHVETPLSLSLEDLKKNYQSVSVVAVNQCSGNSRSLFEPRVAGGQWEHGAVGNAKWTGVRLKDLLAKAGVKAGAVEVSFGGLDSPTIPPTPTTPGTPDFVKSLTIAKANDPEVIVAWDMNDQPLPMLNGFPLRLIVPGWYATYWVKALDEITVLDKPFEGFWMSKAYRVPKDNPQVNESPTALAKETIPISVMTTRSLFAAPLAGEKVKAGVRYEVHGVALDSGKGIAKVEVSTNGGKTWLDAELDAEIGKFSWRRWRYQWMPPGGKQTLMCRATNNAGETQVNQQWNRAGYARNVIEKVEVEVN